MSDRLREAADKRIDAFWPPGPPFGDSDVVLIFSTREDAEAFLHALAFADIVRLPDPPQAVEFLPLSRQRRR
jgi:hypothetical protein